MVLEIYEAGEKLALGVGLPSCKGWLRCGLVIPLEMETDGAGSSMRYDINGTPCGVKKSHGGYKVTDWPAWSVREGGWVRYNDLEKSWSERETISYLDIAAVLTVLKSN